MNWPIKIISKTLMTKISHIPWGGYDKGFYGTIKYSYNIVNHVLFYDSSLKFYKMDGWN